MSQSIDGDIKSNIYYYDGDLYWLILKGRRKRGKIGCVDSHGYLVFRFKGRKLYVHRVIYFLQHGYWPHHVDHINRNRKDNRIDNLRDCSSYENSLNKKTRTDSGTGVKGVYYWEQRGVFKVHISVRGKSKTLGYFDDIELAELVAQEARKKYHGEYAS